MLRLAIVGLALVVAGGAIYSYLNWRHDLETLVTVARETGLAERMPGLIAGMRHDADSDRAALRLARAILAEQLDQSWLQELTPDARAAARQRGLEQLDLAYELGAKSLVSRPTAWEAHLVLGGSDYLRLSRRRDPRLATDRDGWFGHLESAHRLAPTQPEPLRFLAATYLGDWSILAEGERTEAIVVIADAFEDPRSLDLLAASWLRVAPSLSQALAIVPDQPAAWDKLGRYFARRGDWQRYCQMRQRKTLALRRFLGERITDAVRRLRGGDRHHGVQFLLWVVTNADPDREQLEIIERTLAALPAGTTGEASRRKLNDWLDWTLARCLDETECPLSTDTIYRLASLSTEQTPARRASALVAAGELMQAEEIERQALKTAAGTLGPEWQPYWLLKARALDGGNQPGEGLELLRGLPTGTSLRYWIGYRSAAIAAGNAGEQSLAAGWLATLERTIWAPADWIVEQHRAHLELWPQSAGRGLELEIDGLTRTGGALEIRWDGSLVAIVPAVLGQRVEIPEAVDRRRHELQIKPVEGASVATATVRLLPREQ